MAPILSICGAAILAGIAIYNYVLLPAFISPLSKIPDAHALCSVTSLWFSRQRKKQRELKTLYDAHQKHGPIVRLGPNEVSVVSREGLRQIYTAGLEKTSFYSGDFGLENYGERNLVSMQDHKSHSTQKRMISNLFANSYLQQSEDLDRLSRQIIFDRLLPMISEWAKTEESVDVLKLFEWTGIDFVSAFAYGTDNYSDFLRNEEARERYFSEWDLLRHEADISKKATMEKTNMEMCRRVLISGSQEKDDCGTKAVVFSGLYSQMSEAAKTDESGLSQEDIVRRCASEMVTI